MNLIFAAGILLSVGGLWLMPFASYVMQAACFFTTGFFVFGPQMLIGMAAAECSHKEAAGAATGFVGLFAYLGASLSGWPLAQVMEIWHWSGFFVVIAIAAGISALLLLPFLNAQAPEPPAKRDLSLLFTLSGAKLRNFPGSAWTLSQASRRAAFYNACHSQV
jgi:OPA family sugar phosphate sensor protein UhpC-like MFS transporter